MKHILPFSLLLSSLLFSSCSEDENLLGVDSDEVSFFASMPGVSSRTIYDVDNQFVTIGFTVSTFCPDSLLAPGDILPPHCEDQTVRREIDGIFRSSGCRWPGNTKDRNGRDRNGRLKFFAFHPPITEMKTSAGVGDECFIYSNNTRKNASGASYDYRLTKFRVAPDISKQVDFVTATGEGNKTENLYSGIKLNFDHQLCCVEIGVWGNSSLYDVEIAGVRIGGTVVQSDFDLSLDKWLITPESPRGYVDYIFTQGDKVVRINPNEHNTKDLAASIMGNGGKAMVIPFKHDNWDYKNDRDNTANGMYFSALVRITDRDPDHHRPFVFPSTDPESRAALVFLMVRKSDGMVMKRLSSDEYDNFTAPEGQEKRAYGWAAVPVNVDWKAGYTYSYVLDYSKAVGLHDPIDSNPATPIIGYDGVEIGLLNTSQWAGGDIIKTGGWGANSNNTGPDGTVWWK